ncbi:MAG TPA: YsnF/AvaK domain-containing protein [Alphaproteobacteria bacterium]
MPTRRSRNDQDVIPVHEETASVRKRAVEDRRVRVDKHVHKQTAAVRETAWREEAVVERVPVNRVVNAPPEIRHEGDTLVIPVVEEEIVVQRRLVLREEVRVRKQIMSVPFVQNVTLRSEAVEVRQLPPGETDAPASPSDAGASGKTSGTRNKSSDTRKE